MQDPKTCSFLRRRCAPVMSLGGHGHGWTRVGYVKLSSWEVPADESTRLGADKYKLYVGDAPALPTKRLDTTRYYSTTLGASRPAPRRKSDFKR